MRLNSLDWKRQEILDIGECYENGLHLEDGKMQPWEHINRSANPPA